MTELRPPLPLLYLPIVEAALREDLGRAGDQTTDAVIPADATATAAVVAREAGTIAGLGIACSAFGLLDDRVQVDILVADGTAVEAGTVVAAIRGPARAILSAERVALNLLGRLSGIATLTARITSAVEGTGAAIACTRKTTPGLRLLEKYAVRAGGGVNHRFGLDDAVLIKDNHVAVAGGVAAAVAAARRSVGHLVKIEIEVGTLDQLAEALEAGADAVLLDNMGPDDLCRAVEMNSGRVPLEASGGITPGNVREIAETGVDVISMGWLTHSVESLDVALDVVV
ncbi:MAG: carboxylating nicotinate-nucleotide diphosphorylase [Actinobacteria bacterium]|nr:carboxylating nicotinate-nucleotide diphosphorylase [Actinomycetota bacterium]MBU1494813.1 carboxylating nicotinate-nucleotide diphosphorylase [Actinomycetota bacterium]